MGDAGFGPPLAEVGLERLGGLVLGPALPLPGPGEVERDHLVGGEPEVGVGHPGNLVFVSLSAHLPSGWYREVMSCVNASDDYQSTS